MNSSNITLLSSSKETFLEAAQSYEQNVASCKYKEKLTCINQKCGKPKGKKKRKRNVI